MSKTKKESVRRPIQPVLMSLVGSWIELSQIPESETHKLEIDPDDCCGWIVDKRDGELEYYLSTHTFYGNKHKRSSEMLQKYGFNVEVQNWDA